MGFGGRVLDDSLPKYLNTPETLVFRKGELLYGLHATYKAIREKGKVVIVEGYMDFLALLQQGVHEVVASLGTALTANQVRKLKGYAKEAMLVFDSDEAGRNAALKSLPVFLNEGMTARAVALPKGHDPDSFVKKNGVQGFLELLRTGTPLFDFFLDHKLGGRDMSIEDRVSALGEVLPVLLEVDNRARRQLYAKTVSERSGVDEQVIWEQMNALEKSGSVTALERDIAQRVGSPDSRKTLTDSQVLNLVIHYPHLGPKLVETGISRLLSRRSTKAIVEAISERAASGGEPGLEGIEESLGEEAWRQEFREASLVPSMFSKDEVELAIRDFERKVFRQEISESLRKANGDGDAKNRALYLKKARAETMR
jgi:DNA primase